MENEIKKKEPVGDERLKYFFLFLIAEFGWFLFSVLTDASETDQFLFQSSTTTKHTQACTSILLRAFTDITHYLTLNTASACLTLTFTLHLNLNLNHNTCLKSKSPNSLLEN